jgi:hypothetical protein
LNVQLGELETTEVTFKHILPKLLLETPKLDTIISGLYTQPSVERKHEQYLAGTSEGEEQSDERISYGQYTEAITWRIMEYLRNRYISHLVSFFRLLSTYIFMK